MKFACTMVLLVIVSNANAEGITQVEPGVPSFNLDGTVTVTAVVTHADGMKDNCTYVMATEYVGKDGTKVERNVADKVKLVEKSSDCTPAD